MNVLMVGVGPKRVGGMWTVAEQYLKSREYNDKVNLLYVSTSTNGSKITRLWCMILGYIRILWILNTKTIDIVHIHMAEKGSTFRKGKVAKWGRKKGKKVIIHLHAGPFMAWYKKVSSDKQKRIREIFGYADRIFVLGEYWKRELAKIIPEEKMSVLYNGIECPKNNPYNPDAKNIVYFGVMRKEKGTYDLIEAIKLVKDKLPKDMKIVLCGNDLEGNIPQAIEKAGVRDRFVLPGWVTGEEKERIYQEAMIDVLPSYFEGLSMTVLEAMARGIPMITTSISTMPEILGTDGIMVEPGNVAELSKQLIDLVENLDKRKIVSNNEFIRAQKIFSKEIFIHETLDIYNRL